jgi:hypothetical protein
MMAHTIHTQYSHTRNPKIVTTGNWPISQHDLQASHRQQPSKILRSQNCDQAKG